MVTPRRTPISPAPSINVLGEFTAGGNTLGQNSDTLNRYELQNYTSWSVGKHFVKFGGRLRVDHDSSVAPTNYNGTFIFTSLAAYNSGTPSQYSVVNSETRASRSPSPTWASTPRTTGRCVPT